MYLFFIFREDNRSGVQTEGSSGQDRRKLLKRTRSLAVISEDYSRSNRDSRHSRLGESSFDLSRKPPLIPRAKLIDRNSLKDRLVYDNFIRKLVYSLSGGISLVGTAQFLIIADELWTIASCKVVKFILLDIEATILTAWKFEWLYDESIID